MANALYDAGRNGFLTDVNWLTDTIKAMLIDTAAYAVNLATHQYVSDVASAAIVARSGALTTKTATAGVANADAVTFTAVTGPTIEAVIVYKDTGADGTSLLLAYIDTIQGGTPLSITPSGGPVTITWDTGADKIFKL